MEEPRPQKKKGASQRAVNPNDSATTVNEKLPGERKKKNVDWLGERLVEKLDRDHYMCIICFKRMSRGYASCHCNEEHGNITDEMKPFIVKGYLNGKKVIEEMEMPKMEMVEKKEVQPLSQTPGIKSETQPTESKDGKSPKRRQKITTEMRKRLDKLESEGKLTWETKPKKELEKQRTAEGKRVTGEISRIMATSGIPFAKSEAILKIVHEVIGSANRLGPQVLEKIRFSARTLKRRYDEGYATGAVPAARTTHQETQPQPPHENQLPQPTNTQVPSVPNVFTQPSSSIVMNSLI